MASKQTETIQADYVFLEEIAEYFITAADSFRESRQEISDQLRIMKAGVMAGT